MKITLDKEADALYFRLDEKRIVESEEIQPGVILDYDDSNQVIEIEFLGVSLQTKSEELNSIQFQTA
jgi:uncharacterized protein YuzE